MGGGCKRRFRDLRRCLRSLESFTAGQAQVLTWEDALLDSLTVRITPSAGPYKDGVFDFKISLGDRYPIVPPEVKCMTSIYHPNIDPTSDDDQNVCLNLLESDEWCDTFTLEDVIQGLLFLLYQPNQEDPLSPYFGATINEDFEENVRESLDKGSVEDFTAESLPDLSIQVISNDELLRTVEVKLQELELQVDEDTPLEDEGASNDDTRVYDEDNSNIDCDIDVTSSDRAIGNDPADAGAAANMVNVDGSQTSFSRQVSKTSLILNEEFTDAVTGEENNNAIKDLGVDTPSIQGKKLVNCPEFEYFLTAIGAMFLNIFFCFR